MFDEPVIPANPDESRPSDKLKYINGINANHMSAEVCCPRDLAMFDDNDPPQIINIGQTVMGSFILLVVDPEGEDYGIIILRTFTESFFLASDLDEFFGMLQHPDVA